MDQTSNRVLCTSSWSSRSRKITYDKYNAKVSRRRMLLKAASKTDKEAARQYQAILKAGRRIKRRSRSKRRFENGEVFELQPSESE